MHLWAADQALYEAEVWRGLAPLLEALMQLDLVTFAVVESVQSQVLRLIGGISFIHPEYIEEAKARGSTLPNTVMKAAMGHRTPFLSVKQVAEQNARGELCYLGLFGNMDGIDLADPIMADFYPAEPGGA